jgi:hypothetical protein
MRRKKKEKGEIYNVEMKKEEKNTKRHPDRRREPGVKVWTYTIR